MHCFASKLSLLCANALKTFGSLDCAASKCVVLSAPNPFSRFFIKIKTENVRKKSLQILYWPGYLQIPWFLFYYSEFITTCICCIFYYFFFPLCFAVLSTSYSFPSFVFVYVLACLSPLLFCPHRSPNFLSSLVHWMAGKSSSLRFRVPAMPDWETGITRDPPVPSTSSPERSASRASDGRGGWHAAALDTNAPPRASYGWTPTPAIPGQKKWGMGGLSS